MIQLRRTAATAEAFGLECELHQPRRRPASCTRSWRPTTWSGAIWLPGDGKANPTDLTAALARGARHARARSIARADPGHRHRVTLRRARGDRRARPTRATSRPRSWSTAPASGPSRSARLVRGDRAAALGRALLRGHRPDRRGAPGPADAARPGRLHLLQGGGRRPGRRRLRAGGQAVGRARRSCPTRSSSSCSAEDWDHFSVLMDSALLRIPVLARHRHQEVLQRPGELHPRQPVHPGRGARAAGTSSSGPGFNSVGIASAGGAGRALAEWIVDRRPRPRT